MARCSCQLREDTKTAQLHLRSRVDDGDLAASRDGRRESMMASSRVGDGRMVAARSVDMAYTPRSSGSRQAGSTERARYEIREAEWGGGG